VEAPPERQRSVQRAFGVVLVRRRNAERGKHGVARELLERAARMIDLGGGGVVKALEQRPRPLRVLLP
jgi:hypothetical protein